MTGTRNWSMNFNEEVAEYGGNAVTANMEFSSSNFSILLVQVTLKGF